MSGRFVRASKFRHVYGEMPRKDQCFNDIRAEASGDGNHIAGNDKFLAYVTKGGGGPVVVHQRSKVGRLENNPPIVNVHTAKVWDMAFSPFISNVIATGSDDLRVKVVQFPEDGLTADVTEATATLEGHTKKVILLNWHPTANNILGSASADHTIKIWDVAAQSCVFTMEEHKDAINSFEWNSNGSLIASTSKEKKLHIFDPRKAGQVQSTESFGGPKASKCFWMDNLGLLGAMGFSATSVRQYKLWDPRKMDAALTSGDIDQAAGVFVTYFDADNSILYAGGKGDGNIRYWEAVSAAPYLHFLSEFRHNESQKGLAFLPKRACDVSHCEIAHCLRLMRDYIAPISFQVPRKSDLFQPDIYPDTYAGIPSLTSGEWIEGKNKDPILTSMKPGQQTEQKKIVMSVSKSPAELQAELDAAHKRIAELEAQVAKLKAK